ncbi:hypothetical protein D3C71_1114740 [compost metagenome]
MKVVEPRAVAGQGEDQFVRLFAEVNRRPRQAVVDHRARRRRPWKGRAAVFGVDPQHPLAVEFQVLGQRMAPAKTEAAVDFDGTGAIEAGEVERQDSVEGAIGQGQQFFTGNHRHRAVVGGGSLGGVDTDTIGVFRLSGDVLVAFMPAGAKYQGTAGGACQYLLGIEHLLSFAWRNVERETLRGIGEERSRERVALAVGLFAKSRRAIRRRSEFHHCSRPAALAMLLNPLIHGASAVPELPGIP